MGFSPAIRKDALVAAARHCCVCHRYKGLNMEVHHIDQEAEGGSNTFENAIALCLDCHANAGHYNPNHPKGTKYSKPELRQARDVWYKIVKEHRIQASSNTSNHLHFRHMILEDYQSANEIFSGDLEEFPFPNTTLLKNDILKFITPFFINNKHNYQVSSISYRGFNTANEIFSTYTDASYVDKSSTEFPYFHVTRIPKREDLLCVREKLDPFICHLLDNNIDPKEFAISAIRDNYIACGDDAIGNPPYIEYLIFKKFWYSFLALTNISSTKVELRSLIGNTQTDSTILVNVLSKEKETELQLSFPQIALLPNETILVPCGIILVPFEEESFNETVIFDKEMKEFPRSQVLTHLMRDAKKTDFQFIGKYIRPSGVVYNADDRINTSEMHELDLNNLVLLNRWWHMGSCPHLFYRRLDSKLEYVRELLTQTPGKEMVEEIVFPENVKAFVIAELEDEVTYINSIMINGKITFSNVTLNKGDNLEFDVQPGDKMQLKGYYISQKETVNEEDKVVIRNKIIKEFLKQQAKALAVD